MLKVIAISFVFSLLAGASAHAAAFRELAKQDFDFVGFGRMTDGAPHCTYTIVEHGLLITAKHCFAHGGVPEYNQLEILFPRGKKIGAGSVTNISLDPGANDIAWVAYDPRATQGTIALPKISYSSALPARDTNLVMPGSPADQSPRQFLQVSDCTPTGRQGYFPPKPADQGYEGLLIEIDCPAYYGQSGSLVFEPRGDQLIIHGVLSHTFDVLEDGSVDPSKIEQDAFGHFVRNAIFSPISFRKTH